MSPCIGRRSAAGGTTSSLMNSMAASVTGKLLDLRNESIRSSLTDFDTVEHRLEFVSKINGVKFINDSKATNVNSAWYALENQIETVIWIVGGVDKGNDYTDLIPLVESKVKAIICLGTDNKKLIKTFGDKVKFIHEASSAKEAVDVAQTNTKEHASTTKASVKALWEAASKIDPDLSK